MEGFICPFSARRTLVKKYRQSNTDEMRPMEFHRVTIGADTYLVKTENQYIELRDFNRRYTNRDIHPVWTYMSKNSLVRYEKLDRNSRNALDNSFYAWLKNPESGDMIHSIFQSKFRIRKIERFRFGICEFEFSDNGNIAELTDFSVQVFSLPARKL